MFPVLTPWRLFFLLVSTLSSALIRRGAPLAMTGQSGQDNLDVNLPVEGLLEQNSRPVLPSDDNSSSTAPSNTVVNADAKKDPYEKCRPQRQSISRTLFQQGDNELAKARAIYLRRLATGMFFVALEILAVFSIFWGSLWKVPARTLSGWIVDFDQGSIGQFVAENLVAEQATTIAWEVVPSDRFPRGVDDLKEAVIDNGAWVAVVVNHGATERLDNSTTDPDVTYNGEDAITVYVDEARNENAFRNLIRPTIQTSLYTIQKDFTVRYATQIVSRKNFLSIVQESPQTIVEPVSYTIVNLVPFSQPVATAALTTGLIFLLIMSNFIVTIASTARQISGISKMLSLRSLIALRLGSSFVAYLWLSLIYSLVNRAFKLDMDHRYGHAGFFLFWAISWIYMLAVGLALESLFTILKQYLSFFMTMWIVVNTSTNSNPLEVLPKVFHYGFAMPFYNFSKAVRTLVFGTKNTLGLNIGVLMAWVWVSSMTLCLFQWNQRRLEIQAMQKIAGPSNTTKPCPSSHFSGQKLTCEVLNQP